MILLLCTKTRRSFFQLFGRGHSTRTRDRVLQSPWIDDDDKSERFLSSRKNKYII